MNLFNKIKKDSGKELYNNFDYLVTQIKEEWLLSKEGKKKVVVKKEDIDMFHNDILQMHDTLAVMLQNDNSDITFKEYMELVKQNCIVVRMAKKIFTAAKAAQTTKKKETFEVLFDKEEYRFFIECYPEYK